MLLQCIRPFGRFHPGDEVEVLDGAVFDTLYFAEREVSHNEEESN